MDSPVLLTADEHLACVHFLALMNNAMNTLALCVQIFCFNSLEYRPRRRIARSTPMFNILRNCQAVFHKGCACLQSH